MGAAFNRAKWVWVGPEIGDITDLVIDFFQTKVCPPCCITANEDFPIPNPRPFIFSVHPIKNKVLLRFIKIDSALRVQPRPNTIQGPGLRDNKPMLDGVEEEEEEEESHRSIHKTPMGVDGTTQIAPRTATCGIDGHNL